MQQHTNKIDQEEKTDCLADLATAKLQRRTVMASVAEWQVHAGADAADLEVCRAHVGALEERRAAAVAACKPEEVLRTDSLLLTARIAVECAEGRAKASADKYKAVASHSALAEAQVSKAACAVLRCELLGLTAEFTQAMDHALALGAKLRAMSQYNALSIPVNAATPAIPVDVERALQRLPQPNPLHVPLHLLRSGGEVSSAYQVRLAALMADDPTHGLAA